MKPETVLITGATSGIGLAMAHEFARRNHPLLLTSRLRSELRDVAAEISAHHDIRIGIIPADLEEPQSAQRIFDATKEEGVTVDILVNNAGLGFRGNFWEIPLELELSVVRVNVEAVVRLTRLFLPGMVRRRRGRLLNVASVAGFEPGPLLAVYHASKAFVLSLTEALAIELEGTGVTATALCPGPTDTDFFLKAGMVGTRAFQKTHVMAPQEVAKLAYRGVMRGDPTVVAGGSNKALVFARRFMTEGAQARMNKKFYEDVSPEKRKRKRGDIEQAEAKQLAE